MRGWLLWNVWSYLYSSLQWKTQIVTVRFELWLCLVLGKAWVEVVWLCECRWLRVFSVDIVVITALQPVTKLQPGTSPVIFKQQQVVVQQMTPQSYIKSSAPSIQHIITSLPVTASASSAVSAAGMLVGPAAGAVTTTVAVAAPQVTFTKTLSLTITTTAIPSSKC